MTPTMNHRYPSPAWNPSILSNFLVALQRVPGAQLRMGPNLFERVRIVMIERDEPEDADDFEYEDEDESDEQHEVLPPLPRFQLAAPPRLVQGEILRGENGALYERFGNRIRPLNQLAAGPRGEVLEVPANGVEKKQAPAPAAPASVETHQSVATGTTDAASTQSFSSRAPVAESVPETPAPPAPPLRPFFAEPGQWRVLAFGDIKQFVLSQLKHPERLRDVHRLPCHVQVYEVGVSQPLGSLAATILGDQGRAGELAVLHGSMLQPLMLVGMIPAPRPSGRTAQHDPSVILPGERVVRITVAHDPTAVAAANAPVQEVAKTPVAPVEEKAPAQPLPKTAIPDALACAAPYAVSREEALLSLARRDGFGARLKRLVHGATPVSEMRTWQIRLSGRTLDEQLWLVAPPRGWKHDASVRAWAEQTLTIGGYALPGMLLEWEIHWTRQNR